MTHRQSSVPSSVLVGRMSLAAGLLAVLAVSGCSSTSGDGAWPGHGANSRSKAYCMNNLSQIYKAMRIFAADAKNQRVESLQQLVDANYLVAKVLVCPDTDRPYFYAPCNPERLGDDSLAACESGSATEARVCLFGDGHVEQISAADFDAALAKPANQAFAEAFRAAAPPSSAK